MTIYVLTQFVRNEADKVIGLFSSQKKAWDYSKTCEKPEPGYLRYGVYEHTLDNPDEDR